MQQDLHSGRWGPVSLQLAPESQQDQGKAHLLITTSMKPAFNVNDEQQQTDEKRIYTEAEKQLWHAAYEIKLVEEQGLHLPPMVSPAPLDVSAKTNNIDHLIDVDRGQFYDC